MEDLLQMHEAVAKTKRAEGAAHVFSLQLSICQDGLKLAIPRWMRELCTETKLDQTMPGQLGIHVLFRHTNVIQSYSIGIIHVFLFRVHDSSQNGFAFAFPGPGTTTSRLPTICALLATKAPGTGAPNMLSWNTRDGDGSKPITPFF